MRFLVSVFCILVSFSVTISFHQTDYHVIIEKWTITYTNKAYINNIKIDIQNVTDFIRIYNFSVDLVQDLDAKLLTGNFEARKWQNGDYRLVMANRSQMACTGMENPKAAEKLNQIETNFVPSCSIKKGHYYFRNIRYDDSKFPPYAPRGRFMIKTKHIYKDTILLSSGEAYLEIKSQNPLESILGR